MSNAMTLENIVESLSNLTVLEAAELTKLLEEKWGVSAAAPMMMGPAAGAAPVADAADEQSEFSVVLVEAGEKKIEVIKELRVLTGLGLKEAKDMADKADAAVKEGLPKKEAEEMKKKLEAVGAKVKLV
ncbi:MAG: 50S ribosomal protein L7/L12 [Alphaproteobacteria bacterium]|nr:50S ribosomal protein L7/L12 [Alphaproteobacteria bacterium]